MSFDYELKIATDWEPIQILELLSKELQLEGEEGDKLSSPGIVLSATKESEQGSSSFQKTFGFQPSINVGFGLNSKEDYDRGKHTLLRASMVLLSHLEGDAVLLYNSDQLVLQRLGGKLSLNKKLGVWSESELAEVKLPFDLQPLRSPSGTKEYPRVRLRNEIYARLKEIAPRKGKSMTQLANEAIESYLDSITEG